MTYLRNWAEIADWMNDNGIVVWNVSRTQAAQDNNKVFMFDEENLDRFPPLSFRVGNFTIVLFLIIVCLMCYIPSAHFYYLHTLCNSLFFRALYIYVELEGVEPSSKHGTPVLSTCLSPLGFSSLSKTGATNHRPYPL